MRSRKWVDLVKDFTIDGRKGVDGETVERQGGKRKSNKHFTGFCLDKILEDTFKNEKKYSITIN